MNVAYHEPTMINRKLRVLTQQLTIRIFNLMWHRKLCWIFHWV